MVVGSNVSDVDNTLTNSYATGAVTGGNNASVGGFFGSNPTSIRGNYSTGAVSGGSGAFVGGLIGNDMAGSAVVDTYWDLDTSGITHKKRGAGNIKSAPRCYGPHNFTIPIRSAVGLRPDDLG